MAIIKNPLVIISGGSSLVDLSTIEQVVSVDTEPDTDSPQLIECNDIKYILAENGIELGDASSMFENIEVSNWESDNTYQDYPYSANIILNNDVESDMLYNIIYSQTDYVSGNYSEVATLYNGSITIYSKVNTTITIPAIIITY